MTDLQTLADNLAAAAVDVLDGTPIDKAYLADLLVQAAEIVSRIASPCEHDPYDEYIESFHTGSVFIGRFCTKCGASLSPKSAE